MQGRISQLYFKFGPYVKYIIDKNIFPSNYDPILVILASTTLSTDQSSALGT